MSKKKSSKKRKKSSKVVVNAKLNSTTNKKHSTVNKTQTKTNDKRKKNQKKTITIISIISIIVVVVILSLVINIVNLKNKLNKTENKLTKCEEYEVTLEEVSPHYVFLGDSITAQYDVMKYFEGYSVVNSGIGGNTTDDILNNMYERLYRYNPSTVFLMIGTNDVNHNKSAEYIFNNIKKIIVQIQENLPNAKIVLESITPSRGDWGETDNNEKRQEINKLLEEEYKDSNIIYIDLYSILKEKNSNKIRNEYTKDGLHLNEDAYKLISQEQKKYMVTIGE